MITLCSVIYGPNNKYLEYFVNSINNKCKLITEIMLCNLNHDENYKKEYNSGKIRIKEFGLENTFVNTQGVTIWRPMNIEVWKIGHSFGMLNAINLASNHLIYLCDPDTIFYTAVDEVFYNLMKKHNLKFIGAAHHISINYNCKYFPNIVNLLTMKQYMPPRGFFKGVVKAKNVLKAIHNTENSDGFDELFENNYLCQGQHDNIMNYYPNPKGISDTGTLL